MEQLIEKIKGQMLDIFKIFNRVKFLITEKIAKKDLTDDDIVNESLKLEFNEDLSCFGCNSNHVQDRIVELSEKDEKCPFKIIRIWIFNNPFNSSSEAFLDFQEHFTVFVTVRN